MTPYYERGGITILHADCREVLPTLAADSADLVLTDPPYGVTQNEWDLAPTLGWLWGEYRRVAQANAAMLLFGQDAFTAGLILSNRAEYRYSLIWEHDRASGFLGAAHKPLRSHQDIAVFYRQQPRYNPLTWIGYAQHSRGRPSRMQSSNYNTYRDVTGGTGNTEKLPRSVLYFTRPHPPVHPTEKPVSLLQYLIATYSEAGDSVLDSYVGSGSTLVAAMREGRRAIGIEIEERYCEIAARRLEQGVLDFGDAESSA